MSLRASSEPNRAVMSRVALNNVEKTKMRACPAYMYAEIVAEECRQRRPSCQVGPPNAETQPLPLANMFVRG